MQLPQRRPVSSNYFTQLVRRCGRVAMRNKPNTHLRVYTSTTAPENRQRARWACMQADKLAVAGAASSDLVPTPRVGSRRLRLARLGGFGPWLQPDHWAPIAPSASSGRLGDRLPPRAPRPLRRAPRGRERPRHPRTSGRSERSAGCSRNSTFRVLEPDETVAFVSACTWASVNGQTL